MPFDGSGNFNRVMNWVNDAIANIKIKADRHDSEDDNFAAGLSNTITKDGQSQPTANIPMNGKRITNLANPVNPADAMTLAQMVASNVRYDVVQALTIAQQLQAHANLAAVNSVAVKAGASNLLQADRNKLLRVTAAATVTLPAGSAVGNDYSVSFRTMGGALTLAPNGTNQIEGVNANYVVGDGCSGTLWCDGTNWWVDQEFAGAIFKRTIITASGNHIFDKSTSFAEVTLVGGGAGGHYCRSNAGSCSAGAGGGAGAVVSSLFSGIAGTTVAVVIAAGGSGGIGATPLSPTNGGTSTWGGSVMVATGGAVGANIAATTTLGSGQGGPGASGTGSVGDLIIPGGSGGPIAVISGSGNIGISSNGGDSAFAPGGMGGVNSGGGAGKFGAGGGGIVSSTARNGGDGGDGVAIVTEYR